MIFLQICQRRNDFPPEDFQWFDLMNVWHIEDRVLNADTSQQPALFDHILGGHLIRRKVDGAEGGLLNFGIIPSNLFTVLF